MREDRTPDERRHRQVRQIHDPVDSNSGALVEVDVLGSHLADDVEQGDRAAVAFVVHRVSQEDWVDDLQSGLLVYFAEHGLLDGFTVLDRSAEPSPAVRVGDLRLVIAVVKEQAAVFGHDQQHRRAARRRRVCIG
jgi:hypothetical protein